MSLTEVVVYVVPLPVFDLESDRGFKALAFFPLLLDDLLLLPETTLVFCFLVCVTLYGFRVSHTLVLLVSCTALGTGTASRWRGFMG